jgi:formiminotetrahydrofolate cyclodeaminase
LTTAIALAKAAVAGALANVEVNLESMNPESAEDQDFTKRIRERVVGIESVG